MMKQGNQYIELNVSQSTLNIPTITPTSVSQSPLTKEKILEVYADVFDSLGIFPGEPYKFRLQENYVPVRHAPREILLHLQDDFHAKIHTLVKQGVLEKVEHSTEWVNSFIIVKKRCFCRWWKYSNSKPQIQEEVTYLSRSKRSQ